MSQGHCLTYQTYISVAAVHITFQCVSTCSATITMQAEKPIYTYSVGFGLIARDLQPLPQLVLIISELSTVTHYIFERGESNFTLANTYNLTFLFPKYVHERILKCNFDNYLCISRTSCLSHIHIMLANLTQAKVLCIQ